MHEYQIGDVIVIDAERKPIGIVTDRDLAIRVIAFSEKPAEELRVDDVMSKKIAVVRVDQDRATAIKTMWKHGVRRLPVVNNQGTLVGIITYDDLIEKLTDEIADLALLTTKQREKERVDRADTGSSGPPPMPEPEKNRLGVALIKPR